MDDRLVVARSSSAHHGEFYISISEIAIMWGLQHMRRDFDSDVDALAAQLIDPNTHNLATYPRTQAKIELDWLIIYDRVDSPQ